MREISLAESRRIQIELLTEVDSYCKNNNLIYYMSYGTLLGSVRHKGFIPWDDDIDIAMPYPDFQRFCLEYKHNVYKVNYWTNQPTFYCNYAKFEDTRTLSIEETRENYDIGINIDVAPIIGLPMNIKSAKRYFERIVFFRNLLTLKKMKYRQGRSFVKQLFLLTLRVPLSIISYQTINSIIDRMCKKYPYEHSKYVICVGSFNQFKEVIEREKLGVSTVLPFENKFFSAPSGYDEWLTNVFGNYMELPPKHKRFSLHTFKTYWREGNERD